MAALGAAAVLFVAINILGQTSLHQARLDLTEGQLFTLSQGTRNILASLKEPISLKLFFSDKLAGTNPQLHGYGQRVRELLEEYANRSHGMIRLQEIDPEPYSDAEDRAVEAGIQGVPLDQNGDKPAYFGLVGTNTTDHQETIPYFAQEREAFLEYDLTRLVYALTDPKKAVVGVLTDMDLTYGPGGMMAAMRGEAHPYAFLDSLRQTFDVRVLKTDLTAIDKDVSVLLVLRPQKLAPPTLFAVDQYLLAGGRAMVFVDPYVESVVDQPGPGGMPMPGTSHSAVLPQLFQAWGLEMDPGRFVADPELAVRVAFGQGGRRRAVPYPAWLMLTPDNLSKDDVVTTDLASLMVGSAGALAKRKDADITFTPLATSSPRAQLVDVSKLEGEPDPEAMLTALASGGQAYVLAARVTGTLKTAFPDGPPVPADDHKTGDHKTGDDKADDDKADEQKAGDQKAEAGKPRPAAPARSLTVSAQPANLIVVADTDMLEDRFWVQQQTLLGQQLSVPFAGNVDFLANGIDNLAGSSDLIGLRGRAGASRPFLAVEDLHRAAGAQVLAREQALRKKLEEAQKQISDLEGKATKAGAGGTLLSKEEQATIEHFRAEVLSTRKELRQVQHALNQDIERLSATVKVLNIGAMPVLVAGFALGLAVWRTRRRSRTVRE
jgi:ABC-type uncharacterized transport system involved in gliding motility auxiliary subunit